MEDFTAQIFGLFDPEHILSFLVVLTVFGIGKWFSTSAWPWLTSHFDKRRENAHELDMKQTFINEKLIEVLSSLREEIGGFRAIQEQIINRLIPSSD